MAIILAFGLKPMMTGIWTTVCLLVALHFFLTNYKNEHDWQTHVLVKWLQ
jgi:hypothetical protein